MRYCILLIAWWLGAFGSTWAQGVLGDWQMAGSREPGDEVSFLPDHRIEFHSPSGVRRVELFRTMIDRGYFPFWEMPEKRLGYDQPIDFVFKYQSSEFLRMRGLYRLESGGVLRLYFGPGNKSIRPTAIPATDSVGILLVMKKIAKKNQKRLKGS
jgi:hypothetical protein